MKPKMIVKICIDVAMTIALMALMSYSLIGEAAHEWIGVAMLVLFIVHHILNGKWTGNILRVKYTALRVWQTVLVIAVLISMLGSMVSGIILSRYALAFIPFHKGVSTARTIHLISAYWGMLMMGLHLGFHWSMIMGMVSRNMNKSVVRTWIIRIIGIVVAVYGVVAFVHRDIANYLLLKNHFVFFDFSETPVTFFIDYVAVMALYVFIGHYITKLIRTIGR